MNSLLTEYNTITSIIININEMKKKKREYCGCGMDTYYRRKMSENRENRAKKKD